MGLNSHEDPYVGRERAGEAVASQAEPSAATLPFAFVTELLKLKTVCVCL